MAEITHNVVVGATRKDLYVTLVDELGTAINIAGSTIRLQGKSLDLPSIPLDVAGAISDAPGGVAKWTGIGSYVTHGNLAGAPQAKYTFRVKLTDAATKIDFTPEFDIIWHDQPV